MAAFRVERSWTRPWRSEPAGAEGPAQALGDLVGVDDAAVEVGPDDQVRDGGDQPAVELLAVAQGVGRAQALGDVLGQGGHADDPAFAVDERRVVPFAEDGPAVLGHVGVGPALAAGVGHQVAPDPLRLGPDIVGKDERGVLADGLRRRIAEDLLGRVVPLQDAEIGAPFDDRERRLLDVEGQALLAVAQGFFGRLAADGPGDLGGDVLEHALLGRAVGGRIAVVLDDHGPQRLAVDDEGYAEPDRGGRADDLDLAAAAQDAVRGLVAEEGPAGPDDVLGQALAGLDRGRRRVDLVDEIGKADEARGLVEQGDVEVGRRHDRADGAVDRAVEVVQAGRRVGGLGDHVEGGLEELGLLAVVDVLHHADHPPQVAVVLDEEEAAVVEPAVAAVLVPEAVVDVVGLPVLLRHLEEPHGLLAVLRMDALDPGLDAAHLLGGVAEDLLDAAAPADLAGLQVVVVDRLARGGDEDVVLAALGDVGDLAVAVLRGRDGRGRVGAEVLRRRRLLGGTAEDPHVLLGGIVPGPAKEGHPRDEWNGG